MKSFKKIALFCICLLYSILFPGSAGCNNSGNALQPSPVDPGKKQILFAINYIGCDPYNRFMELLYKEAFSRLGYTFSYSVYPMKRTNFALNAGQVDGVCTWAKMSQEQLEKFPNLIRVKEPVWETRIHAYALNPEIRVNGWQSLQAYKHAVIGHAKGMISIEELIPKLERSGLKFHEARDPAQSARMLALKRIDMFLGFPGAVAIALNKEEFKDLDIYNAGPVVPSLRLFPYLHKKHAGLASPLAKVLRQMKEDGKVNRIVDQIMPELNMSGSPRITVATGFQPLREPGEASFFSKASDIVSKAFALKNYQVCILYRTGSRAYEMAKNGQVDGTIFWRKTGDREKDFYFSKPVISAEAVFFYLQPAAFDWTTLEDLSRFRAGIIRGIRYEDRFDTMILSGKLPAVVSDTARENFLKLLAGEVDYTPGILENGYVDLKKMFPAQTAARFTHHPRPLARHKFYLLLSKQKQENSIVISDFNHGLYQLQQYLK